MTGKSGSESHSRSPLVMAFVAWSGTGKTTLVESLIRLACERGLKVGALKHDAHEFELDKPGKDSYRFTAAGAEVMALVSGSQTAVLKKHSQPGDVDHLIRLYFQEVDLVLVEGWKNSSLPRIEIHRPGLGRPMLSRGEKNDPHLVAVASDEPMDLDVPVLDLNAPEEVLNFICQRCATP